MPILVPMPVTSTGVGRPDNSKKVSKSVATSTIRQDQLGSAFRVTLPTIPYPYAYWDVIAIGPPDGRIPVGYSVWGYSLFASGDTTATTLIGTQLYQTYDILTDTLGPLTRTLFLQYAPQFAELHSNKGFSLRDYPHQYLVLLFAHYSANPTFTVDVTVHGLLDVLLAEQGWR